jgi:Uma2 family endonuclease
MEAKELGENLIIELISKESEYGEDDKALFRDCLKLPGLGLLSREPSMLKGNSLLARVEDGCNSDSPRALRYSGDSPSPCIELAVECCSE